MKHLKVTLFQSLAIHYFVPYDAFNVSLVESLSYDEMQKNKKNLSFAFNKTKFQKQCLIGDDIFTGRNFLHKVGTSDHHRKFHLSFDQGFSGIKIIFFGISDLVSELSMNIGSFALLPTEGFRETVSGQTGLAQSSLPEHSEVRNDAVDYYLKNSLT